MLCNVTCPVFHCIYRKGGKLPEGVISHPNGTLSFGRPLNLSDSGVYECAANNEVGVGKAEVEVKVIGR